MKSPKTIVTTKQLAEMRGYADESKLIQEADRAGVLFENAGSPHIWLEGWDEHIQKAAASQLSARNKSGKSLADTDQLGIINSNLKRLPESIHSKERKRRSLEALLKSATTTDEKLSLRGEIGTLKSELRTHKENLKKARERQKQLLAQRAAELDALEAEENESEDSAGAANEAPGKTNGK